MNIIIHCILYVHPWAVQLKYLKLINFLFITRNKLNNSATLDKIHILFIILFAGGTLSSFVIRTLGLSKRVEDDQDPREAILRFAKEAEENPYWIAPAYAKTQPETIFQNTDEDNDEPSPKKIKVT